MAVIPPIIVEKFTCSGNGLLYEGHTRESPADLRAMIMGRIPISDKDKYVSPISWQQNQILTIHFGRTLGQNHGGLHKLYCMDYLGISRRLLDNSGNVCKPRSDSQRE